MREDIINNRQHKSLQPKYLFECVFRLPVGMRFALFLAN